MRLIYYPHTPRDYEPQYFTEADPGEYICIFTTLELTVPC